MTEFSMSDQVKSAALKITTILNEGAEGTCWSEILVRGEDGKVDVEATKRAFGFALRGTLRAAGELEATKKPGRRGVTVDLTNIARAVYHAFTSGVKGGSPEPYALDSRVVIGLSLRALKVDFLDEAKAKKMITQVLDDPNGRFEKRKGVNKFAGVMCVLKGQPTLPEPFLTWGEMQAKDAPAPAEEAKEAPAPSPAPAPVTELRRTVSSRPLPAGLPLGKKVGGSKK